MDIFPGDIPADRFRDLPDPAVVHHGQLFDQFILVQSCEIIGHQAVHMLFQRADRFHQSSLKVAADAHYLAGSFHLSGERSLGCDKLVKRQTGNLHHAVVQHGFETCVGLARNRVGDLVQCVSQGDLRRNLGDGISGSLTCQRGRTAYTGIYFDDTVLKAVGMKGVLNVTSAGDPQLCDDIQSGRTEHLVFLVSKSLGRRYHDGVSCVYAYRVNILHIADSDTVARAVAHYFIFNLFPSGNAAFHQNFSHTGKSEAVLQDFSQLVLIVGDSAAAASQSISRTEYHRIADGVCESETVLHGSHYFGSRYGLADLFHGIFEFLTVLGFADRLRRRTDKAHIMLFQEAFFLQLHGKIKSRLSSEGRKHAVGFLLHDQLLYHLNGKGFDINSVGNIFIRHDRSRIGIQKNNLDALLFQRTAGLGSRIVEFRRLADDDRAGTDHKNFMDIFISRHCSSLPSFP